MNPFRGLGVLYTHNDRTLAEKYITALALGSHAVNSVVHQRHVVTTTYSFTLSPSCDYGHSSARSKSHLPSAS